MGILPSLDQLRSFGQQAHDALLAILIGQDRRGTFPPLRGAITMTCVMEEV